jgi:hypothetical protein
VAGMVEKIMPSLALRGFSSPTGGDAMPF